MTTADASAKPKARSKRTTVPAPTTGTAGSAAIDTLTGGNAPRIVMIPVERVHPHPRNPRQDVGDVTELAADIKANGVDQAATVVPHPDLPGEYLAVIGHRRRAATILAGLPMLPAVVREDLTPAQQHKMMVRENIHRADLTVVEEADAYQGLLDIDGLSVDEIAEGVSRSVTTVRERLKVARLPQSAREALHTHAATLTDARALDEFDDDPAVRDDLAAALGTDDFRYQLQAARRRREVRARFAPQLARLAAANIPENPDNRVPEGSVRAAHVAPWTADKPATGRTDVAWDMTGADALTVLEDAGPGWSYRLGGEELYIYRPRTLDEIAEQERAGQDQALRDADREAERAEAARQAEEHRVRVAERAEVAKIATAAHEQFLREVLARRMTAAQTAAVADGVAAIASEGTWDESSFLYAEPSDLGRWAGVDTEAIFDQLVAADEDATEEDAVGAARAAVRVAQAALDPGRRLLVVAAAACEPVSDYGQALPVRRCWYALLEQLGYTPSEQERTALLPPANASEDS